MTSRPFLLSSISVALLVVCQAQETPAPSKELDELKAAYKLQIQKVVKPVDAVYKQKLEQLLKQQQQAGQVAAAAATSAELKRFVTTVPPTVAFGVGDTQWISGKSRLEFTLLGRWRETWKNKVSEGRWRKETGSDIIVVNGGEGGRITYEYRLDPSGQRMVRLRGNVVYQIIDPANPPVETPPANGKDEPSDETDPSAFGKKEP